jgi:hypothetical protein
MKHYEGGENFMMKGLIIFVLDLLMSWSRHSSVCIAMDYEPYSRDSIPVRDKGFLSPPQFPDWLRATLPRI